MASRRSRSYRFQHDRDPAKGLTKRFASHMAVDDLSFRVLPGRVTGFVGPNGAGKSTTMRMIVGLDRPTSGTVTIGGRAYRDLRRPLHQVGAVLDVTALHPGRSAHDHLLVLAQSNGIRARRVRQVLELVGLASVGHRRAGTFSLGMAQRLGLAAALLGDPPVLLCDEPVNGLDPEGVLWIRTLLRALAAEGRTVFVSSHLMSEMALTADHLVVLGQGRLLADDSTAGLIARSSRPEVLVRTPDADLLTARLHATGATTTRDGTGDTVLVTGLAAADIADLAAAAGVVVHELTPQHASLETAYLDLTGNHAEFTAGRTTGPTTARSRR